MLIGQAIGHGGNMGWLFVFLHDQKRNYQSAPVVTAIVDCVERINYVWRSNLRSCFAVIGDQFRKSLENRVAITLHEKFPVIMK